MRGFLRLYDMASPQKENGFTPIAHELLEAFILAKFTEYQRKIVLFIWRKTYGWNKKEDDISNSQFVIGTGINKGNVSRTIKELKNAKVVISRDNKLKVNKNYEEWKVISRDNKSYLTGKQKVISTATTIESRKKLQKKDIRSGDKSPHEKKDMKYQKNENDFGDDGLPDIDADTGEQMKVQPLKIALPVLDLLRLFEPVNPAYYLFTRNKTEIAAIRRLRDTYGEEKLVSVIKALPQIISQPYAPRITSPYQLETNLGKLTAFISQDKNNKKSWTIAG